MEVLSAIVNWLHLTAAMAWLGAVFSAAVVVPRSGGIEGMGDRVGRLRGGLGSRGGPAWGFGGQGRLTAAYYRAFSPFAWGTWAVLFVTGAVKADAHLENGAADLVTTPWGRLLLLKLVIAFVMVGLGAHITYRLIPRLTSLRRSPRSAGDEEMRRLQAKIGLLSRVTAILGMALLFVVTLL